MEPIKTSEEVEGLWDVPDVMEYLGIRSTTTIYDMIRLEGLPAHRLGRGRRKRWRFIPSEVAAWVRSACLTITPDDEGAA